MKKAIAIFFLIIYGFTSVGATVHSHYCMNKFVGASLWHNSNSKCGKCGMTEKNSKGCCKDEHKQIKLKADHQKAVNDCYFFLDISPEILTYHTQPNFVESTISKTLPNANAPPPKQGIPIYILYCTYLI